MQAFGGGNGDPDALRALDEANKNALPSDGAGSAQQAFTDRQRLDGRKDNSDIAWSMPISRVPMTARGSVPRVRKRIPPRAFATDFGC
jgi:hypothetical protein